ncbi:MAG: TlpA family protein disulfide reductase [Chloroflexi bacterium]|nr:TlpA family protein disulfide reductase [Chloroflexota bacterium]
MRRLSLAGGLVLAALAVLAYLALGTSAAQGPTADAGPRPLAPDFLAPTFSGGASRLSDFRGQPVVVNFWASWCPPCRAEARELEHVWQAYRDRGVVFLGINVQDTEVGARTFLDEFGVTYPNVRDVADEVTAAYEVSSIPTTVFIDRNGRIVSYRLGQVSEQQLVARLEELLP